MTERKNNCPPVMQAHATLMPPSPSPSSSPRQGTGRTRGPRRAVTGLTSFVLAVFIYCFCSPVIDQSFAAQKLSQAHVHQVHDGDTVTLRLKGKKYRTRLIGIDAPEMGQRPWGRRSKEHLIKIMRHTGWNVFVETDVERQDKYGRLLAYLWTKKKKLINEQMLLDGYAVLFSITPNVKYVEKLTRAEQRAQQERNGIWGLNGLEEAPVEYRTTHPRKDQGF